MDPKQLVPGKCYYLVVFEDEWLTEPIIQTLRYKSRLTRRDGTTCHLFEELGTEHTSGDFGVDEADLPHLVLDEDGLLEKLHRAFAGTLARPRSR
jgi:hypothetical protein